jgi:beta-carotene 3-hydroxylase
MPADRESLVLLAQVVDDSRSLVAAWATFLAWVAAAFIGMEILSYILHRWIFHGILWKIHITHHTKRHGLFEANDLFSFFFTGLAIVLLVVGFFDPLGSPSFPLGLGMTIYGLLYFTIHDLMTHRRFFPLSVPTGWIEVVRRAHLAHHQSTDKEGQEPFGLFLFPYRKYVHPKERRKKSTESATGDQV